MKTSEILIKAKRVVERSDMSPHKGICSAIHSVCGHLMPYSGAGRNTSKSLQVWVRSMMRSHRENAYLFGWLVDNGHMTTYQRACLFEDSAEGDALRAKLKATRLAWLDWMIAECEKAESVK